MTWSKSDVSKLQISELKSSDLKQLTIQDLTATSTYGRHFQVKVGDSQQEVVFHDLFKTAQRLMSETSNPSELEVIQDFIGKLRAQEIASRTVCELRCSQSSWYRFLTFFSRLGNIFHGLGSHWERLESLENELENKKLGKITELKNVQGTLTSQQKYELAWSYPKWDDSFSKLINEAADKDYPPAQRTLGEIWHEKAANAFSEKKKQVAVEQEKLSQEYYEKAAQAGDLESAIYLGKLYSGSLNTDQLKHPINVQKSILYLELAKQLAEKQKVAAHVVGLIHKELGKHGTRLMEGGAEGLDVAKGLDYCIKAAQQGDIACAFRVVNFHLGLVRVSPYAHSPKNKIHALEWCETISKFLNSYSGPHKKHWVQLLEKKRLEANSLT